MAKYIYKYTVPLGVGAQLLLDEGEAVLHVGVQFSPEWLEDVVVFWMYCTDGAPTKPRTFRAIGTSWEVPEGAYHWGSIQHEHFVWHLMELPAPEQVAGP